MKNLSQIPKPQGMFYTFGNDVDETSAPLYRVARRHQHRELRHLGDLRGQGRGPVGLVAVGQAGADTQGQRPQVGAVPHPQPGVLDPELVPRVQGALPLPLPGARDRQQGRIAVEPAICRSGSTGSSAEFAKRYGKSGVIETVLLGIQGDFGEAIYSVTGGGWTFNMPGEYHNHAGYWCDDPYALASFRKAIADKYGSVDAREQGVGHVVRERG